MIKSGQPVFFGCDVGKFSDSTKGIMDTALYEYEVLFLYILAVSLAHFNFPAHLLYYPWHVQS